MSVIGGGCVDGIAQLQPVNDGCGAQIQIVFDPFLQKFVRDAAGSKGIYIDRKGPGYADGIAELNLALSGSFGSHNMFGNITRHVRGASIHLGGIFSGESAAAVLSITAIGVCNDLSSGQTGIGCRTAQNETTGGIDIDFCVGIHQVGRNHRLDQVLHNILTELFNLHVRIMLGRNDHSFHAARFPFLYSIVTWDFPSGRR